MKVLLFSGGLDSSAVAHWTRPDRLLFIDYGQRSVDGERQAAFQIASELGLEIDERSIDARSVGTGDLAGLPSVGTQSEFWPFRNQFLITVAAMAYADAVPLEILVGTVASDYVHPDGSSAFIDALNAVLGVQGDVTVNAPAIALNTGELIQLSGIDPSILGWAFSCHTGGHACGQCRGCAKNLQEMGALRLTPPPSATPR